MKCTRYRLLGKYNKINPFNVVKSRQFKTQRKGDNAANYENSSCNFFYVPFFTQEM